MLRYTLAFAASVALAACGGSDGDDLTSRYGFRAQAFAYQNLMPSAAGACVPLIVVFAVRAESGTFPQSIRAKTVTLAQAGLVVWRQPVDAAETGLGNSWTTDTDWLSLFGSADGKPPQGTKAEQILGGVARGCTPQSLRVGDPTEASVLVEAKGAEGVVSVVVMISSVN